MARVTSCSVSAFNPMLRCNGTSATASLPPPTAVGGVAPMFLLLGEVMLMNAELVSTHEPPNT